MCYWQQMLSYMFKEQMGHHVSEADLSSSTVCFFVFFNKANTGQAGRVQSCFRSSPRSGEGTAVRAKVRSHSQSCGRRPGAAVAECEREGRAGGSTLQRHPGQPAQVGLAPDVHAWYLLLPSRGLWRSLVMTWKGSVCPG